MSFHVGQKVVCVEGHYNPPASGGVKEGSVYTIRETGLTSLGEPGVRLNELEFSCGPFEIGSKTGRRFIDGFMKASRFRPVVERKTSISIFTAMPKPTQVDA